MTFRSTRILAIALPAVILSACDSTSPNSRPISLAFSGQSTTGAALDITVTAGTNSLIITKAQVVVRKVSLESTSTAAACSDDETTADDCDEVTTGPFLVDLPLANNAVTAPINASVPAGTYSRVDFQIHKPSDANGDAALVAANPNMVGSSIRVEGTYNGAPFVYKADLTEHERVTFPTPITVDETNTVPNLTIQMDLSSWFKSGTTVIDPATANKGGANENLVKQNIRASLRAFRDDDKNGRQ